MCYQVQENAGEKEFKVTIRCNNDYNDINVFFQGMLAEYLAPFLVKRDKVVLQRFHVHRARDSDSDYPVEIHCSLPLGAVVSVLSPTIPNGRCTIEPGRPWTPPTRALNKQVPTHPQPKATHSAAAAAATTAPTTTSAAAASSSSTAPSFTPASTALATSGRRGLAGANALTAAVMKTPRAAVKKEGSKSKANARAYTYMTVEQAIANENCGKLVNLYGVVTWHSGGSFKTKKDYKMSLTVVDQSWQGPGDGLKVCNAQ